MKSVNYKEATTYYLVGNLFNKGMSFITVPIFTRILSTFDYGIVTTYNSWIEILSMVLGFALHMAIRAAFTDYRKSVDDFMSVTTTFTVMSGFILSTFIILGSILIKINLSLTLIVLCLIQGVSTALVQNYSMYLMMQYRYKFRTALMILPNFISIIFSIMALLFVVRSDFYIGRIVPTAIINIIFGVLILYLVYRKSSMVINKEYLKYGLMISSPLVIHGIALNILSQSDRTMITWLADASQTGIYSLVYNFSMLATVVTTSLDGIWVPWFINKLESKETDKINMLAKDYVNLMTYAMVSIVLIGPEIIKLLATKKYLEGIMIIPPIVLANYLIFIYTLYVNIEHFHKKTSYITVNTVVAASINIVLNFIFIPYFGYIAAAYSTMFSYFIAFILHARYAKKLEPDIYPIKTFISPLVHIGISVLVFYLFINEGAIRWGIVFLYILMMFYKERKRIAFFCHP